MSSLSKMIFKCHSVSLLFLLAQFLHGSDLDVELEVVRAAATPPVVVRGDATNDGQYPFSVIFYEKRTRVISVGAYLSPICSGSIINTRWVMTTAVPLGDYAINAYFMLAGIRVITVQPDIVMNFTDNIYHAEMMVVHPKWHEYNVNNVGMVKTSQPLVFGKELGTLRIPARYDIKIPDGYNDTVCTLNIWASAIPLHHLMGAYQVVPISKQTIYLNVKKDPKLFCPDLIFTDKTLCLTQFDPANPHDICTVNLGAIVQCDCQAVGLFTGVKGKLECDDVPPSRFTAVNLTQYLQWITMVSEAPDRKGYTVHEISSATFTCLSFILRLIHFLVVLNI